MSAGRPREFNFDDALTRALHVFWAKGYEGTSLPDLTTAMGINRPSLYATFGNKEELFRKALDKYAAESKIRLDEMLSAPTAYEAVEKFIYGVADGTACPKSPRGCLMVQGALSCGEEAQPIKEELIRRRQTAETALRRRFEKGIADGDMPNSVSAADLARFYATVVQGMAVQSTGGVSSDDMRGVADWALKAFPRK